MVDSALEEHIDRCAQLIRDAEARYKVSGKLADKAAADGWRIAMERAVDARWPVVVEVEAEKGV